MTCYFCFWLWLFSQHKGSELMVMHSLGNHLAFMRKWEWKKQITDCCYNINGLTSCETLNGWGTLEVLRLCMEMAGIVAAQHILEWISNNNEKGINIFIVIYEGLIYAFLFQGCLRRQKYQITGFWHRKY